VLVKARRSTDEADAESATGHGLSTNIIEASLEAYLGALERLVALTGAEDAAPVSGALS
jgi:hypothetical protein